MNMTRLILLMLTAAAIMCSIGAVYAGGLYQEVRCEPVRYAVPRPERSYPKVYPAGCGQLEMREEPEIRIDERDAELLAQTMYGEYRGPDKVQQAAVAWCVLNRCDYLDEEVEHIVTAPFQFIGYDPFNPVTNELYDMAVDVLTRWEREKLGEENVGRVLPRGYLWFSGNGRENIYRDRYAGGQIWDWSLENPYAGN